MPVIAERLGISIVTAVLDSAGTIERCLDSVWRQRQYELEHIVVDGGSNDGTVDVLERRRKIANPPAKW